MPTRTTTLQIGTSRRPPRDVTDARRSHPTTGTRARLRDLDRPWRPPVRRNGRLARSRERVKGATRHYNRRTSTAMAPDAHGTERGGSPQRRLTAEYVAARVLLDATSIEEAASRILQAICESLGWEHGALWTVDHDSECLRCAQSWSASSDRFPEFRAASQHTTFSRGIGLPGRVWANATPAWIPDVVADANFPRAAVAAREGLHAA